jgi:hypothetical protein
VLGQPKPFVKADRHMHATAYQPTSPISAADTPQWLAATDARHRSRVVRSPSARLQPTRLRWTATQIQQRLASSSQERGLGPTA